MRADQPSVVDPAPGPVPVRRHRRRRVALAAAALVATGALSACGDIEDQSLCTAYDELLQTRASIEQLDPAAELAGAAEDKAEAFLEGVQRLQETADGRFGNELDDLEAAANDIVLTLGSVQEDEDHATWAPLIEDDLEAIADAEVTLDEALEAQCPSPGEEG